jgi:hypothetical protein
MLLVQLNRGVYYWLKYNKNDEVNGDEMGRACSTDERENRILCILGEELEVNRQLGRPRSRWEDNIKLDFRERG